MTALKAARHRSISVFFTFVHVFVVVCCANSSAVFRKSNDSQLTSVDCATRTSAKFSGARASVCVRERVCARACVCVCERVCVCECVCVCVCLGGKYVHVCI